MAPGNSPAKPAKRWTAEADTQLLLLLVQMYVKSINYNEVAARLGDGSTANAIEHRMRKLRGRRKVIGKKGVKKEEEADEIEESMRME